MTRNLTHLPVVFALHKWRYSGSSQATLQVTIWMIQLDPCNKIEIMSFVDSDATGYNHVHWTCEEELVPLVIKGGCTCTRMSTVGWWYWKAPPVLVVGFVSQNSATDSRKRVFISLCLWYILIENLLCFSFLLWSGGWRKGFNCTWSSFESSCKTCSYRFCTGPGLFKQRLSHFIVFYRTRRPDRNYLSC